MRGSREICRFTNNGPSKVLIEERNEEITNFEKLSWLDRVSRDLGRRGAVRSWAKKELRRRGAAAVQDLGTNPIVRQELKGKFQIEHVRRTANTS